ncbi:LpqB family beta-propeller domain-containing protein [Streptomyces pseudovenezuelae]|nr:LpqB family beta-propeller domain-containing protein [Streptomyces pseudovenezuelae]
MAYAACGVVLLAGCASMPDSGDLRGVESTPRQDTQVRVFAMPPQDDAQPSDIVSGFLEALTSDDPAYSTARQYLTRTASQTWQPGLSTTVLQDGPGTEPSRSDDVNDLTFTLTGTKVATVDEQQAYAAAKGTYGVPVHLTRDKKTKQWRIDRLPQGVVMGKSDFQRNYMSVNKYYLASNTASNAQAHTAAVADPVYVRRYVDPTTEMVRSLLNGPSRWLNPVVRTSFPTGAGLEKGVTSLTPDDQNMLTVPLNENAARVGETKCNEMAAQLLFTLQNLTPIVDKVELRSGSKRLCSLGDDREGAGADAVATRASSQHPSYLYFIDSKKRLARLSVATPTAKPDPVPGALGETGKELLSVAVSRDEQSAAGVADDGKDLYAASLVSGGSLGDAVLTSHGPTATDRLTAPSWDAHGDLWVADRDPDDPRLLMLEQGRGEPIVVKAPGLDGRIQDVRVAADGVRIALVVTKGDQTSLLIGRIERTGETGGKDERPTVWVQELRSATPELEDVTAMSWAGDSRLVVVGREQGGVQTMRYVQVDGSTPEGPAPAALTGVKELTAAEDDGLPLVAYSEDGIVRLQSGGQWQKVVTDGMAPVYPG